jgi:hypothetical protein
MIDKHAIVPSVRHMIPAEQRCLVMCLGLNKSQGLLNLHV